MSPLENHELSRLDLVLNIILLTLSGIFNLIYPFAALASLMSLGAIGDQDLSFLVVLYAIWNMMVLAYPGIWILCAWTVRSSLKRNDRLKSYIFSVIPIVYILGLALFVVLMGEP